MIKIKFRISLLVSMKRSLDPIQDGFLHRRLMNDTGVFSNGFIV